jgi:hypothetical protein
VLGTQWERVADVIAPLVGLLALALIATGGALVWHALRKR